MRYFTIFFALILTACASTPTAQNASTAVPLQRLLAGYSQFSAPAPDKVMITIIRDTGFAGPALAALVSVDATDVAKLRAGERLELYVEPGNHIFGVVSTPNPGAPIIEQSYDIKPSDRYFFRISTGNGVMAFQRTARIN